MIDRPHGADCSYCNRAVEEARRTGDELGRAWTSEFYDYDTGTHHVVHYTPDTAAQDHTPTSKTFEEEAMALAVARYKYRGVRDQDIYDFMRRHGHRPGGAGLDMRFWMTVNRLRQDPAMIAAHPQLTAELNRRVEAAG